MLQFRIASPEGLTDDIVEVLTNDPAVSGLAVMRGASVRPVGDIVEAHVAREAANDIVDQLRGLGLQDDGSLQIEPVRTWMSKRGLQAERRTPGSSADAVVWAEVTKQAYEESEFNWTFVTFMSLATLIAIVLDSQILVIGAMVLGPEFGAVAGLGVALVRRRMSLFTRAASSLVWGFVIGIAVTTVAALIGRAAGWITVDDITGPRPDTGFIYTPDRWSFLVALIAAAAGVLSLTSDRVGGLSGVFISVTTIPAAGNVALGIAFGVGHEIWGSALQLLINLAGMALAGWGMLALQKSVWARASRHRARLIARFSRSRT